MSPAQPPLKLTQLIAWPRPTFDRRHAAPLRPRRFNSGRPGAACGTKRELPGEEQAPRNVTEHDSLQPALCLSYSPQLFARMPQDERCQPSACQGLGAYSPRPTPSTGPGFLRVSEGYWRTTDLEFNLGATHSAASCRRSYALLGGERSRTYPNVSERAFPQGDPPGEGWVRSLQPFARKPPPSSR
jgi:hypothetical protein